MQIPQPIEMTPEQLKALQAGQGVAHIKDPSTQRIYVLIEQGKQPELSEEYFRMKLEEGIAESNSGHSKLWNPDEIKDDLLRRRAENDLKS